MRICFFAVLSFLFAQSGLSQITSVDYCGYAETSYTNGAANDSIFYFYENQPGNLSITPDFGQGPYDFVWQMLDIGLNQWISFSTENDVFTSAIVNLQPGCYRVSVFDINGVLLLCDRAWIGWSDPGNIQVFQEANCLQVHLWATIEPGSLTSYYNPPPDPMYIDATTEITVCFDANHTWVSDLGFYLVGPPSCGSPNVLLSPNPGAIGQGPVCNSGNNVIDLCFTTESSATLNVCANAPSSLSGTYGNYGPGSTPINWSTIYGCDATSAGWSVQIYDCIGLDVGALTSASIQFDGINICNQEQPVSYSTPSGFSSPINDNSCSPGTASIFTVPLQTIEPVNISCGYEWNADPWLFIADSTSSLDITLPAPLVPTVFSLDWMCYDENNNLVSPQDGDGLGCNGGGNNSVLFTPVPWVTPILSGPEFMCENAIGQLYSSFQGTWSGGNIDPESGIFSGFAGNNVFLFTPDEICVNPATISVYVQGYINNVYDYDLGELCQSSEPVLLDFFDPFNSAGYGEGLEFVGFEAYFNPSGLVPGSYEVVFYTGGGIGACSSSTSTYYIEVMYAPLPIVQLPDAACINDETILFTSDTPGGVWYGNGIVDSFVGLFDPSVASLESNLIEYEVLGICPATAVDSIWIESPALLVLNDPGLICSDQDPFLLGANLLGGIWSGEGILNQNSGLFDAQSANSLNPEIEYFIDGICPVEESMVVEITPAPIPDAGPNITICEGDSILISEEGTWDSISWNNNAGSSILAFQEGIYTVSVSLDGCSAMDQMTVSVTQIPNINLGTDQEVCVGQTALFEAPFSGLWSNGIEGQTMETQIAGMYVFTYPNLGCPAFDTVNLSVLSYPYLELGSDQEICPGDVTSLYAGQEGIWSTGVTADFIDISTEGFYSVELWNGQCMTSDTAFIDVLDLAVADLGPDIEGCIDEPVYLYAGNAANTGYEWSNGEEDVDFILVDHNQLIWVMTENECGMAYDEIEVTFVDCSSVYYIPNAFTPDGDGVNDVWRPETYRLSSYEMVVVDRWGEPIFRSSDPKQYWTGNKMNGDYFVPEGVYVYFFQYIMDDGTAGEIHGTVAVLR